MYIIFFFFFPHLFLRKEMVDSTFLREEEREAKDWDGENPYRGKVRTSNNTQFIPCYSVRDDDHVRRISTKKKKKMDYEILHVVLGSRTLYMCMVLEKESNIVLHNENNICHM